MFLTATWVYWIYISKKKERGSDLIIFSVININKERINIRPLTKTLVIGRL